MEKTRRTNAGRTLATNEIDYAKLPTEQQKVYRYVRSRLSDRARHILRERKKGRMWKDIGDELGLDLTTVSHDYKTAMAQLQLALEAPWMKRFRNDVLEGGNPPLPDALVTLNSGELAAIRSLTREQIKRILTSKQTSVAGIADEVGVAELAVSGTRKKHGKWPLRPYISHEVLIAAYNAVNGNITKTAQILGLERTCVWHKLDALGLHGKGRRHNGPNGKNQMHTVALSK